MHVAARSASPRFEYDPKYVAIFMAALSCIVFEILN